MCRRLSRSRPFPTCASLPLSSPTHQQPFHLRCLQRLPSLTTPRAAVTLSTRACATSAASHEASSSSSTATAVRRRSKRLSYADADRVYSSKLAKDMSSSNDAADSSSSGSSATSLSGVSLLLHQRSIQNVQHNNGTGVLRRLHSRAQQQWQILLLSLLRLPYAGALVVRLLEAYAYAAYVRGSVTLFTRHRVGPPLSSSNSDALETDTWKSNAQEPQQQQQQHQSNEEGVRGVSVPAAAAAAVGDAPLLQAHALPCLYIGQSRIHSRGLFTRVALRKGTRILAEPHRSLLLGPHFLTLLADTHEKLPDTWHYTQPTGSVVELVTQAQPHHLMNHSCNANVCSGLSRVFWPAAMLTAQRTPDPRRQQQQRQQSGQEERTPVPVDVHERLTQWSCFADANSFFVTRDVAAGEELTLDYSTRMAPLFAGETRHGVRAQGWLLCRCGQPCCRHYVYRTSPEAATFLQSLRQHSRHSKKSSAATARGNRGTQSTPPSLQPRQQQHDDDDDVLMGGVRGSAAAVDLQDPLHVMARLLELGFDDELVLLSYAGQPADVVAYVYGQPLPSFAADGAVPIGIDATQRRVSKRELLLSYRHVFHLLNEAAPVDGARGP